MPWPDRTVDEWKAELMLDWKIITIQVEHALRAESEGAAAMGFAVAIKESRRMTSDLYRMAEKHGVTREQIDAAGPL